MKYDIVIIGGGMVGAAFALALSKTTLQIALIDASPSVDVNDPRLIALNDSSCTLLKNLQVWEKLFSHAAPIQQVHISHLGHFNMVRLVANELGMSTLGHVVPAKYINSALYESLEHSKNIHLMRPAVLKHVTLHEKNVDALIEENGKEKNITGKILVGADGTHSTVRKLADIPAEVFDYQQSAIVTITELSRSHHHIAYERFLQQGAIAMLPLTGERAATIWTDQNNAIHELMQQDDNLFLEKLQKTFGFRLGRFKKIGKRFTFPLHLVHAKNPIKQNVILIGNAAHTLHPIAAQGLNLALHEVAVLAEHFTQQKNETLSLQNLPNVAKQKNISLQLSHRLTELFSKDFFGLNCARQLAMLGLDVSLVGKKYFMNFFSSLPSRI